MIINNLYKNLMEYWKNYGHSVYENQDLSEAGKNDCEELYLNNPLESEVKNRLATELIRLFYESQNGEYYDEIINYLNRTSLVRYYFAFIEKLNIYIKEELISKENLFSSAKSYLINSDDIEGIKFGLTLLRYCESEEAKEILQAFSNHNEFIFYCIEGLKEYKKCNSSIFEIAKVAKGYGKIMAITNLEYTNDEIKNWVIEAEADTEILETVLVAMTYNNDHYNDYFFNNKLTERKYNLLTKKLKELYTLKGFFIEHISIDVIYGFLKYYKKFNTNFDSLYVVCELLSLFLKIDEEDINLMDVISISSEDKVKLEEVKKYILEDENNYKIIKESLDNVNIEIDEIIDVALALNVNLKYDDFKNRLLINPNEVSIYNYLMTESDKESKESLIEFAKMNLNLDMVTHGAEALEEECLDHKYIIDSCLYLIITYMDDLKEKYIDINVDALNARYTPTRRVALNNLREIDNEYLNEYIHLIENSYKKEVNKELKQSIVRFLDGLNNKKKRQYESINGVRVLPYTKDIFLTVTKVEEMDKYDLTIVENKIKTGALVYLKREKENSEDENSIMVLTEKGYVIGYISKENNYILKNLMDWGKILYGEIKKVDEDFNSMEIKVYLSYVDVMREVKDTFNMVTDQHMGYLN